MADDDDDAAPDAFDLAEPTDVLAKLPDDFAEQLASKKWKDRKEALEAFYAVAHVPRIRDGSYGEIVGDLAKCMKDANVMVVTCAANCIVALAEGLRAAFAKHRAVVMNPLLERLKEKKQSVADALGAALDAVFLAAGLADCVPDIVEALKHKNPQVKQGTVKFLVRCLRTTRDVPDKADAKAISEAATKLLADSDQVIRAGGAEALGTLMKILGERAMNPYMEGLDDIRKAKIKEYFQTAE
ncbi:Microtubule-associated protein, microtubule dynamics during spindle orientation, partial [Ascosphaera acerosa]